MTSECDHHGTLVVSALNNWATGYTRSEHCWKCGYDSGFRYIDWGDGQKINMPLEEWQRQQKEKKS